MMDTTKLEAQLEPFFTKQLPSLPSNVKEVLVKIAPYLAILGVVFAIPAVFALLGLGALASPFVMMQGMHAYTGFTISIIFVLIEVVLEIMAIPGLFARSKKAWKLMFYVSLVSIVSNLLSFNLGSLIIGTLISFYILFQVKPLYK